MSRQTWQHEPSVELLLAQHPGETDPETIIRARAQALVDRAMKHEWTGPPFDVALLAEIQDIKVEYETSDVVYDAMLVPSPDGQFTIKISMAMPKERQRFNIGHEISHTFFPDCAETIQLRGGHQVATATTMVESLCDIGAAEMLFPLTVFRRDVAKLGGPSLAALVELRGLYEASWEATANRLVSTSDEPCVMVVLSYRLKPKQIQAGQFLPGLEPRPKLRIEYAVPSDHLKDRFLPKYKSIAEDSILYDLLASDWLEQHPSAEEDWGGLGLGRVGVEAMRLPSEDDSPKLLALVRPAS